MPLAMPLFLHIHMEGIEMDEDVVGTDRSTSARLFGGVEQMVLVAVDGLDAELQAALLRGWRPRRAPSSDCHIRPASAGIGSLIGPP